VDTIQGCIPIGWHICNRIPEAMIGRLVGLAEKWRCLMVLSVAVSGCGESSSTAPPVQEYSIGGTVSSMAGSSLTLLLNGGSSLQIQNSGTGSFKFATSVAYGASYAVTIASQPTGEQCTATNGSGTVNGDVTNVSITCVALTYTLGGTVNGLTKAGLVLSDGIDFIPVTPGATTFQFPTPVPYYTFDSAGNLFFGSSAIDELVWDGSAYNALPVTIANLPFQSSL